MRYISCVVALLEACDVTKHGGHLGRHLGFTIKSSKAVKLGNALCMTSKKRLNKYFASFSLQDLLLKLEDV